MAGAFLFERNQEMLYKALDKYSNMIYNILVRRKETTRQEEETMKLKMNDVMTREAYECLTAEERRAQLKVEQAKECSGLRRYPGTCSAVLDRIPAEWWSKYSAEHIGEVMRMLKAAYDDGRQYPSPDEWKRLD